MAYVIALLVLLCSMMSHAEETSIYEVVACDYTDRFLVYTKDESGEISIQSNLPVSVRIGDKFFYDWVDIKFVQKSEDQHSCLNRVVTKKRYDLLSKLYH